MKNRSSLMITHKYIIYNILLIDRKERENHQKILSIDYYLFAIVDRIHTVNLVNCKK